MNFYKRFVGDIQVATGHLTPTEFGLYDRLLDHYYSTEQPLPADVERCRSITRAMTKSDQAALDRVLAEFFTLGPKGYEQRRCEVVIAEALPKIEAARANGKRGGRPRKTEPEPGGFGDPRFSEPSGIGAQTEVRENAKASESQSHSVSLETEPPPPSGVKGARRSRRCPSNFVVDPEVYATIAAECRGVNLERATANFRDCEFKTPRGDWQAAWRTWMRKEADKLNQRNGAPQSFRERDEAAALAKYRGWTGGRDDSNVIEMEPENAPLLGRD